MRDVEDSKYSDLLIVLVVGLIYGRNGMLKLLTDKFGKLYWAQRKQEFLF